MTDSEAPRPRAQYGEYASAEEQQRARGLPEQAPKADAGAQVPQAGDAAPLVSPANAAPQPKSQASSRPNDAPQWPVAEAKPKHPHPVDRVVTLILLALGLFLLLNGIPGYLALPDALQLAYDQLGAGTYGATEVAASLGVTALVVQAILWIATAASAWFAVNRGRMAWWIALLGGVLSFIATMVIVAIALFADPGFVDSVSVGSLS